ncbi:MAG: ribulokinase [Eubacteriales bacterium]|nr:ribulokinase [Eubacteriales bacterium]
MSEKYVIGVDYGTLSGRGVLVRCSDGKVLAAKAEEYRHGVMDRFLPDGTTALPDAWALQYPADYLEVLEHVIPELLRESRIAKTEIVGMGFDFTSCTMLPIDEDAVPLSEKEEFRDHRNAYAKLWKHHGAQRHADIVNRVLEESGMAGEARFGGRISSEVLIPKIMEILEEDPQVYEAADELLEAGDWVTRVLTGSHRRSCSMAGYKAWWDPKKGYLESSVMKKLAPGLEHVSAEKMPGEICAIGEAVGRLSEVWAEKLGLQEGMVIAPTIIDSHAGVPGGCLSNDRQAMMVLGTSSVVLALSRKPFSEKGVCGGVRDAIVPGYYALESGLACVGDLFGWFVDRFVPADYAKQAETRGISVHELLSEKAEMLQPGESGVMALDWWNGNKTPYVDGGLTGELIGMTLNTKPEEIYRALIEATAFGTRQIMELYEQGGVALEEIIASGGIAMKNPMLMQIYADVLGKTIRLAASDQAAALGSAIYASLSAGVYDSYWDAVQNMSAVQEKTYVPNPENTETYQKLYEIYCDLGELMGEAESRGRTLLAKLRSMKR